MSYNTSEFKTHADYEDKLRKISDSTKSLESEAQHLTDSMEGLEAKIERNNHIVSSKAFEMSERLKEADRGKKKQASNGFIDTAFSMDISEESRHLFASLIKDSALNFDSTTKTNPLVKNDLLKSEHNLHQIYLEKKEKEIFELSKDYKVDKEFSKFWFKRVLGLAHIVENSLINGIAQVLFTKEEISFEELINKHINAPQKKPPKRRISGMSYSYLSQLRYFGRVNTGHVCISFEDVVIYNQFGDLDDQLAKFPTENIEGMMYNFEEMMIRFSVHRSKSSSNKRKFYLFIICQSSSEFTKWIDMLPCICKHYGIYEEYLGKKGQIAYRTSGTRRQFPFNMKQLEELRHNSDFVISDNQDSKIELYRRINEAKIELSEAFANTNNLEI